MEFWLHEFLFEDRSLDLVASDINELTMVLIGHKQTILCELFVIVNVAFFNW
jgi:hypothetical protein